MNWLILLLAGLLEIGWVISLKLTDGFTKVIPMIFYGFFGLTSAFFFSKALKSLPMGVAYAVWMGVAIIGTTIAENVMNQKPYDFPKVFFMLLIITGIMGLKIFSNSQK
ncbi:MAG: multidrug efflux SMR transporter [Melioribacteraceae bacterium]|nr:multidrug efflux SMR transporter [Melioribacteraceae bacterium]MCF8356453.1 multidrug efflux SMR transporter [Melioribacteraceae bacterium]MCF8395841.1 multidrug efflux SMR transporter [Melioribacteraceae bacterium]MCF8420925.1 multidrug efflux SMR transporter [Melioribacteraceae bacterium]